MPCEVEVLGTSFDGSKIREAEFEQPVSNEDTLRRTVAGHLQHEYGEAVADAGANGELRKRG